MDVAKLVFEIDSTQAVVAKKNLTGMAEASERVEASARKVKSASEMAGIGVGSLSSATGRATRSATEHATALGTVERAALRAARAAETRATSEILAARNADFRARSLILQAKEEAKAALDTERAVQRLTRSYDPLQAALDKTGRELAEAKRLYDSGALSAERYGVAVTTLNDRQRMLTESQTKATTTSRNLQYAGLNLGRQFADVGVQLASGTPAWLIFVQQGPQIVDVFAQMKLEGMGVSAVLKGIWVQLTPLLAVLAPIGLAVGAVAVGFGLLHRELSKEYPKDITKGMNLTEEQLKRVKDRTVSFGDTVMATFTVIGRHIMSGPVGDALKWLGGAFAKTMDYIGKTALGSAANIVGAFVGAFEAIKATWKLLPAAIGDLTYSAANGVISGIEFMVNKAIDLINSLITKANGAAKAAGLAINIQSLQGVSLGGIDNPYAGAGAAAGSAAAEAFTKGFASGSAGVRKGASDLAKEIASEALARARKDALKKAGDAGKGAATPRDQTDERSAQLDGMIAQARAEELQARISITKDVQERANLEKLVLAQELAKQKAALDRQAANIADDKGLSAAKKKELLGQLQIVADLQKQTDAHKQRAIDEATAATLAREALDRTIATKEAGIALLASQVDLASTAYERGKIELEILKAQHTIERLKLEEIVASKASTENERAIANARLGVLEQIQNNEVKAAKRANIADGITEVGDALSNYAKAFDSNLASKISQGFNNVANAFATGGPIAAAMAAFSELGKAVGGSTGAFIQGFGSGGIVGGVLSLFGYNKAKKKARAAEEAQRLAEEQARIEEVANERRALEIALMEAQGDAAGALAAKRADELAKIDASNRAMQEQLWALEDAAEAKAKADALAAEAAQKAADIAATRHGLEIDLLEAMGRTDEASKMRVADQRAALDESLRGLFDQIQAERELTAAREAATAAAKAAADLRTAQQSDAANLLATARANLKAAYDAQVSEIKAGRDQMQGYADSFREFRMGLSGAAASGADFYRIAAKARLGDTDAMGQLVGAAQAADTSARSGASTQLEYLREQTKIRAAVQAAEDTATRQVSIADKQLAALEAQVSGFVTLNESTLTVAAGISAVVSAINTLNMTFGGAMSNPGRDWGRNPDSNQALARQTGYSGDFGGGGFQKWIEQQSEATKATARDVLTASGQAYRIAFAAGGVFTSPTDFRMGDQLAQMAEAGPEAIMPLVQTGGGLGVRAVGADNVELKAEIRDLKEVLNAALIAIAKNTSESARIARRWDGDGLPPTREVAA